MIVRTSKRYYCPSLAALILVLLGVLKFSESFAPSGQQSPLRIIRNQVDSLKSTTWRSHHPQQASIIILSSKVEDDDDEAKVEEEVRLKVLGERRKTVRSTLKAAESLRNFRLTQGWVPEVDEATGKPLKSDGKAAVTLTAFMVAGGAVALRIGGRAALISTLGLYVCVNNLQCQCNANGFWCFCPDFCSFCLFFGMHLFQSFSFFEDVHKYLGC